VTPRDIYSTAELIIKIVRALADSNDSHKFSDITPTVELQSLNASLISIRLAVGRYENTPISQSLAQMIHPEVSRCCFQPRRIYDQIERYQRSLIPTHIHGLWRTVYGSRWDVAEYKLFKEKVSACRNALQVFLRGFDSFVSFIYTSSQLASRLKGLNGYNWR